MQLSAHSSGVATWMGRTVPLRLPIYDSERRLYLLPLTQEQFAIVDLEDLPTLQQAGNWGFHQNKKRPGLHYAIQSIYLGGGRSNPIRMGRKMHRFLMESWGFDVEGLEVDHINGNGLDNRRSNLRLCPGRLNAKNKACQRNSTTGHRGVTQLENGRYRAGITVDGRKIWLGCFGQIEDAIAAYEAASIKHHGEYGRTATGSNVLKLRSM